MSDAPTSLRHPEAKEDAALAQDARAYVAENPALQLIAELVAKLRSARFSWWSPESLREAWSANARMKWFAERPDIRQRITSGLTGLAPRASRNKQPDFQAALIDSVLDDGDVTPDQFEAAFDPLEIAAYAPAADIWHRFRDRMPWDQDVAAHQELVGWLLDTFLASASSFEGMTRKPILSSHALRTTIPGKIWHSKIPLEIRVAIDDLRFQRERAKPGEPFHAIHDLSVATPAIIATNIPLRELVRVVDVAERAMGLPAKGASTSTSSTKEEPKAEAPKSVAQPAAQPAVPPPPDKAPQEKAPAEKVIADKAAPEKSPPKSAIERMAEKVVEKVKEAAASKDATPKPAASAFSPPAATGKMAAVAAATPNPLPVPPGELITPRGAKTDDEDRGDDIIVETDDSFKFDDDDADGTGVGTKDDPRGLSKKPEQPPPPPKR